MRGLALEVVICFEFHENLSRGLGAVEGRKSASPIDYRTSRDTKSLRRSGRSGAKPSALEAESSDNPKHGEQTVSVKLHLRDGRKRRNASLRPSVRPFVRLSLCPLCLSRASIL